MLQRAHLHLLKEHKASHQLVFLPFSHFKLEITNEVVADQCYKYSQELIK